MTTAQVALIWLLFAVAVFAEPEKPPQPATFLRPPSPSAEPRSVVQRVARWFFSSGDDVAGHHGDHGPPPPPSSPPHPSDSHGRHGSLKSNYGPPRFKYGPPKPPATHYGPPKTLSNQHEFPSGPPPGFFISRPEGKPSKRPDHGGSHHLRPPKPPVNQYGPPKAPSPSYGPPKPTSNYGPPTNAHGGPSASSPANYISLKSPSISGPPLTPPSIHYGSPKPTGSSGPSSVFHGPLRPSRPPSPTYGSPGPLTHHRPPSPGYGPPRSLGFVTHPKPPKKDCNPCNRVPWVPMSVGGGSDLPPSSSASSGGLYLPSPSSSYGPPPPLNIPDASAYNSGNAAVGIDGHIDSGSNGQSGHIVQGIHTSHTSSNGSPGSYGPPPIPPLLQIPNIQYGTPESTASVSTAGSIHQGPAYLPTAPSSQSHQQTAAETQNGIYRGSTEGSQSLDVVKSVTLLSESYPPTVNTPGHNSQLYQSPVHLIPASNPNWPSPPAAHSSISSAGNNAFNDQHTLESEFTQHTKTKGNEGSELEVIKSVPLADFVSSIEYPIEVVQSPSYVDVSPDAPGNNGGNSLGSAEQKVRENSEYLPNNEEIVVGKPILKGELNIKQVAHSTSNEGYKNYNGDDSGNLGNNVNHQGENDQSDQRQSGSIKQPVNVNSVAKDQTEGSDLKSEGNNFYSGTTHQSPQSFSQPARHYLNVNQFNARNNITFPQDVASQTQHNQSGFAVGDQQHSTSTDNVYSQDQRQTNDQPLPEQTSGLDYHQQSNGLLQPPHQQSGNNYYLVPQGPNVPTSQKPPSVLQSGFAKPPEGQRVIVDIQPSVQTSAQGASLIYQINNLKAPPPTAPFPSGFPNRPTQTAVFVSFQNGLQAGTPPQSLPAAVPPPGPGPVQGSFARPSNAFRNPLIAFQSLYKPDIPAQFLNPPGINPPPIWSQSAEDYIAPWANAGGPPPFKYLPDSSAVASFSSPGLYPPPPVPPPQQENIQQTPQQGHKRPKKIQVIVPYTSTKNLAQFPSAGSENAADLNAGPWTPIPETNQGVPVSEEQPVPHVNCSDQQKTWQGYIFCYPSQFYISQPSQDYQQHQESRPVTQKATVQDHPQVKNHQPVSKTGEVQHIFASNIRELLRGEEEVKNVTEDTLLRLQKNIDEWTALAYSKHNRAEERKTTTAKPPVSALRHRFVSSKQIPEEYLTTTPLPYDDINQSAEPFAPTAVPALRPNAASSSPPISSRFFDHEAAGSHSHAVTANAYDKPAQKKTNGNDDSVDHKWKFFENNLVLPEAVTVVATTIPPTAATVTPAEEQVATEPDEERQRTEAETEAQTTPLTTTQAPWTNLQVSISPITRERVYVVTPLSSWDQQQLEATSTPTAERRYTPTESYREGKSHDLAFHSPRFVVRPTPATTLPLQTLFAAAGGDGRADDRSSSSSAHDDANSTASAGNTLFDDFVSLFNTEEELSNSTTATPPTSSESPTPPTLPPATPMAMRSRAGAVFLRLLEAPTYSPPDAAAIHTITGHSKVSTVATSATPGGRTSRDSYLRHFPDPVLDGKAQQDLTITAADHARNQRSSS